MKTLPAYMVVAASLLTMPASADYSGVYNGTLAIIKDTRCPGLSAKDIFPSKIIISYETNENGKPVYVVRARAPRDYDPFKVVEFSFGNMRVLRRQADSDSDSDIAQSVYGVFRWNNREAVVGATIEFTLTDTGILLAGEISGGCSISFRVIAIEAPD